MFTLLMSAGLFSAFGCGGAGDRGVYCSELATPTGRATIIQSGPVDKKPLVRKEVGPGYSILEQDSGGNHAIVIQSGPGTD
ncbi:MAG: hypothetical protein ABR878_03575 [Roseiarcus sp.]|jgi:hypothetical protein